MTDVRFLPHPTCKSRRLRGSLPPFLIAPFTTSGVLKPMSLGRFAAIPVVVLAGMSLSACVFNLSDDEAKPKVRASEECPTRDQANWDRMQAYLAANKEKPGVKVTESGLQYRQLQ